MPPIVVLIADTVAAITAGIGFQAALSAILVDVFTSLVASLPLAGLYAYNRQQQKKALRALTAVDASRALTIREPAASRQIIYGRQRVGGTLVFAKLSGTANEFLNLVVVHADHECNSLGDFYLNDEVVPLDGSGNATGKYAGFCTVKNHLGASSQTVDTDLQTAVTATYWDNNHRLRGMCYSYVKLKYDKDLFPGGIPNISRIIEGRLVYDPRTSTTAYSTNTALCVRDYLLDTVLGLGAASSEVDDTACQAAANVCDEAVSLLAGGTEPRYTVNGIIDTGTAPGTVLQGLLGAMAGISPYVGGVFVMSAGAYASPTVTLGENDLRGPVSITTRDSRRDACNGVKGTYLSEANAWQPADFPPVVNATYLTEDGIRMWLDISLPFTTSAATAQRLAKIELERNRSDITVSLPCKLTALNVKVGDNISLTLARYGWSSKVFEVTGFGFAVDRQGDVPTLGIDLMLRATASTVWDWSTADENAVADAALSTLYDVSALGAPTGLALATGHVIQADGTVVPRIHVSWTQAPDQFVTSGGKVHVEYKKSSDSDWIYWSDARGDFTDEFITDVVLGEAYDVRIRFQNVQGASGAFASDSITLSTLAAPAAPTGLAATAAPGAAALTWDKNSETDIDQYLVYRNTVNDFSTATHIWSGRTLGMTDHGVTAGVTYYYWVTALNTSGNESTQSSDASVVPDSGGGGGVLGSVEGVDSISGSSYVDTGATVTISSDAGTRLISISGNVEGDASLVRTINLQLQRDGSDIGPAYIMSVPAAGFVYPSWQVPDTPGAGSHTYTVQAKRSGGSGGVLTTDLFLTVQ